MKIKRKLNYRLIELDEKPSGETVGVRLRCGDVRLVRWNGFIELRAAKEMIHARPVKLEIYAYTANDSLIGEKWEYLKADQHIQGCYVDGVVYAVLVDGLPRVI